MTREELLKLGVSEELADKLLKVFGDALEAATTGLKKNKDEILEEKKSLQKQIEKYKDIDPEEAREAMIKLKKLETEKHMDKGDFEKILEANNSEWQSKIDKESAKASKLSAYVQKHLVENQMTDALVKLGVTDSVYLSASKALLREGVEVVEDGEGFKVLKSGKSLSQALEEWGKTDEAKKFITADTNSGGGGGGRPKNINLGSITEVQAELDKAKKDRNVMQMVTLEHKLFELKNQQQGKK